MPLSNKHGVTKYNAGCRCTLCKTAMSEYRKGRRRELAESVGDAPTGLTVINGGYATSDYVAPEPRNSVLAAVAEEIASLGDHKRPGLAAAALALAADLDNPKAVSTRPSAAGKLADMLGELRKNSSGRRSKLAEVRQMTRSAG